MTNDPTALTLDTIHAMLAKVTSYPSNQTPPESDYRCNQSTLRELAKRCLPPESEPHAQIQSSRLTEFGQFLARLDSRVWIHANALLFAGFQISIDNGLPDGEFRPESWYRAQAKLTYPETTKLSPKEPEL